MSALNISCHSSPSVFSLSLVWSKTINLLLYKSTSATQCRKPCYTVSIPGRLVTLDNFKLTFVHILNLMMEIRSFLHLEYNIWIFSFYTQVSLFWLFCLTYNLTSSYQMYNPDKYLQPILIVQWNTKSSIEMNCDFWFACTAFAGIDKSCCVKKAVWRTRSETGLQENIYLHRIHSGKCVH